MSDEPKPSDWQVIEMLAEEHPYIVALLNYSKLYVCTGTIINKQTVLTSGSCLKHSPQYIVVGTAALGKNINENNIFEVAYTILHTDYIFQLTAADPNVTQMHSNIGLIFTIKPILEFCFDGADIGNYYASELRDKQLYAVGYGKLSTASVIALQKQVYHQSPCTNPKWYYCICGYEYATRVRTYDDAFGEGAPIIFGTEVVAISATPCGSLVLPVADIKYGIFTVIGPYMAWIERGQYEPKVRFRTRVTSSRVQKNMITKYIYILLIISKLLIQ